MLLRSWMANSQGIFKHLGRRRQSKRPQSQREGARRLRLVLEPLEDRTLLDVTVVQNPQQPAWADIGPSPIINGQITGMSFQNNPVVGAVAAFAVAQDPSNGQTVAFAATAGGGVWETNNLYATISLDLNQGSYAGLPSINNLPAAAITGGPHGGGAPMTPPFSYKVTQLLSGEVETNATAAIPLAGNAAGLVDINVPAAPNGVIGRNIYRAVPGANGQPTYYWLVGTIAGNGAATLTDDTTHDITMNGHNRVTVVPNPQWQPLTDNFASLSMESIAVAPDNPYLAFAGTGMASASHEGGPGQGIIMLQVNPADPTKNIATLLGAKDLAGHNISAIVVFPTTHTLLVAADDKNGGIWISSPYQNANGTLQAANQVTFTRVNNNMPKGPVTDLAYIPSLYTPGTGDVVLAALATQNKNAGIYLNTPGGAANGTKWTLTTKNLPAQTIASYDFSQVLDMHLTVWKNYTTATGGQNTVYVDTVVQKEDPASESQVDQVFRIDNLSSDWTPNVAPVRQWRAVTFANNQSIAVGVPGGINPGGQGTDNSPIVADPTDRNSFYIGGDAMPDASALVLRVTNTGLPGPASYNSVTGAQAQGPGPLVPLTPTPMQIAQGMLVPTQTYTYCTWTEVMQEIRSRGILGD
jgi:hypothetical protein